MKKNVLLIVNEIRLAKGLSEFSELKPTYTLRDDLGFSSFDLAELTVKIEDVFDVDIFKDGLINTVSEIYEKLER